MSYRRLERLTLENLPIDDLSALTALPKLDYLYVRDIKLRHCSPRNEEEIRAGVSCYEKDGHLKSWWKRLLRM